MSKRRSRTSSKYINYALQLYFSGLSLRKTSERISQFITRNHVSIWNWIQRYKPKKIFQTGCKLSEFIIDETLIKVGNDYYVWLWVAIESQLIRRFLVFTSPSKETCLWRNGLYNSLIRKYGKHNISTDGGTWYGIHKHVDSWMLNIIFILLIKKVLSKELSNI
jgi:putative transposase